MYNINSHINVQFFFKKLPGEAGNVPLVYNKTQKLIITKTNNRTQFIFYGTDCVLKNAIRLFYYKEGVLRFQNILKLKVFFSFGRQEFRKSTFQI